MTRQRFSKNKEQCVGNSPVENIQLVNGILIQLGSLQVSYADVLKGSTLHYLLTGSSVGLILKTSAKEAGFLEDLAANLR